MGRVIVRKCENNMRRLLILFVLVLTGCGDPEEISTEPVPIQNFYKPMPHPDSINEITEEVNVTATITDDQVEILNRVSASLSLNLSSITNAQAEGLSTFKILSYMA